ASRRRSVVSSPRPRLAVGLGAGIGAAGVMHFVRPEFFDAIVPPWLPPSQRFWTLISGVAELVVGVMLFVPRWRRSGAIALFVLLVAVYPANLYMTWDWRNRPAGERVVSWVRLPLQFVLFALARMASGPWRTSAHRG
ncbi:MAG: hypothetical protein VXW34_02570, partial [Actinomycetota bacterium]|nr:hypothetical protein [Actinomycetota bacterium]